jgi:hypothetical protein
MYGANHSAPPVNFRDFRKLLEPVPVVVTLVTVQEPFTGGGKAKFAKMICNPDICCLAPVIPSNGAVHLLPHSMPELPPLHDATAALALDRRFGRIESPANGARLTTIANDRA